MLDFDPKVAHLLRRATLGPTYAEVQAASEAGLPATLEALLAQLERPMTRAEVAARAVQGAFLRDHQSLRAGWMLRLMHAPGSFPEKLTVFWHGHFATAIAKVRDTALMAQQVDTLRGLCLGSFKDLLLAMARDPAMLIWLDNNLNVKGKPNENFARELMELFALGIGNYTEADVQEVARAFTGWNMQGKKFAFFPDKHDDGPKTVLARTAAFDGEELIDYVSSLRQSPRFLCGKLWRFFVSRDPADADLEPMIDAYQKNGRRVAPALRAMFTSPRFFAPEAVGTQIKSPVEFVVGAVRALDAQDALTATHFGDAASAMGQDLYNPPDVSGWKGGEEWISTFTLLERIRLVRQVTGLGRGGVVGGLDTNKVIAEHFITGNDELVEHFCARFLFRKPPEKLNQTLREFMSAGTRVPVVQLPAGQREEKIRGLIRLILVSPEYQLC